jgi:chromosome segregation ATPase
MDKSLPSENSDGVSSLDSLVGGSRPDEAGQPQTASSASGLSDGSEGLEEAVSGMREQLERYAQEVAELEEKMAKLQSELGMLQKEWEEASAATESSEKA